MEKSFNTNRSKDRRGAIGTGCATKHRRRGDFSCAVNNDQRGDRSGTKRASYEFLYFGRKEARRSTPINRSIEKSDRVSIPWNSARIPYEILNRPIRPSVSTLKSGIFGELIRPETPSSSYCRAEESELLRILDRNTQRLPRRERERERKERTRGATRSSSLDLSSFQRYRSTIRHRRRYTYTYNFSSLRHPRRRGAMHLFEHAILSPSASQGDPAHLDRRHPATSPPPPLPPLSSARLIRSID